MIILSFSGKIITILLRSHSLFGTINGGEPVKATENAVSESGNGHLKA